MLYFSPLLKMPRRRRSIPFEERSDSDFDVDIETLSEDTVETESMPSSSGSPRKEGEYSYSPSAKKVKIHRIGQRRSSRLCAEKSVQESIKDCCLCFEINDVRSSDEMVTCCECGSSSHQSCLKMSDKVLSVVKEYPWQCSSCKTCETCTLRRPKSKLMACSSCNRGYHTFCISPNIEDKGTWKCQFCNETKMLQKPSPESSPNLSKSEPETLANKPASEDKILLKRGPGRPRKAPKFDHFKKAKYRVSKLDQSSDNATVSAESEDSDARPSVRRSPIKRPGFRSKKKCPTPGCDSSGHYTGKFDLHHTISGCPLHHNMTAEECKIKAEERAKESQERVSKPSKQSLTNSNISSDETPRRDLRRQVALSLMPEKIRSAVRGGHIAPSSTYKTTTLPPSASSFIPLKNDPTITSTKVPHEELDEERLAGLTSDFDLNLFKSAWKKAVAVNEEEQALSFNGRPVCRCIVFGMYEIDTWYSSPYPDEFQRMKKIYLCEFCLKYMKSPTILRRHMAKCSWRHPPGLEIYRKNNLSVFEVDGKKHKTYCQNLCLMAKLFLDHKTLYYDVEPFLFYVMTKADSVGCRFIGYFSKEKKSFLSYNVSCILSLPAYMKQGYGKMLIDFSYLLSKVEGKVGSPEKPLSDLGLISYRSYWKSVVLKYLQSYGYDKISVRDISQETAIHPNDIVSTLQYLGILKYWKGKHVVLRSQELMDEYNQKVASRPANYQEIDPGCLRWTPPVTSDVKT